MYGLRAGLAVFATRRDDVSRIAFAREVRPQIAAIARWARSRGIPCTEASDAELTRMAGSSHHEGLCVATRPRRWLPAARLADHLLARSGVAIALDRVRNPYNVGAILRSAAFFGVDAVLFGSVAPQPALAPDAVRVAEGGAEHIALSRTTDLADTLGRLRARGVHVWGADAGARTPLFGLRIERPALVVLGHEREGLSDRVRAECEGLVAIPGCGAIESLNVAVAAGLLLAELVRPR